MRWLTALLLILGAAPLAAQPAAAPFNPAADYVTAGQDGAGYRAWVQADPARPGAVAGYYRYLAARGVAGIVPTWQLLRTASAWRGCAAEPFEVPPESEWPNMVETLQYVRAHVVPVVGEVEPVSVYRNEALNLCAKGAADSAHRHLYAIDLVPHRPTTRDALMRALCAIHAWQGGGFAVGLGFYKGLRFHVDSKKYRKWGAALGDETTVGCPHVMAAIAAEAAASRAAADARQQVAQALAQPPAPADPSAPLPPAEAPRPSLDTGADRRPR